MEYKISDQDFGRFISCLSQVNLAKVSYCDFMRWAESKVKELIEAKKKLDDDVISQKEQMKKDIERKEEAFKIIFLSIRDNAIPETEDKDQFAFNEASKSFVKKEPKKEKPEEAGKPQLQKV